MNKKYTWMIAIAVALIIVLLIINSQSKKNIALEQQVALLQQQQQANTNTGGFDWVNLIGGTVNSFLGGLGAGIGSATKN